MKYLFRIYIIIIFVFYIRCLGQQSIFDSLKQVGIEQSKWLKDLNKIIEAARIYRFHFYAHGDSQGSYIGFTIPKNCDSTEFGTYSIYEILPNRIVIQANLRFTNVPAFTKVPLLCAIDSNGVCGRKIPINEYGLDKIGELAYKYCIRSASDGGGGGSYIGFEIPARYECTIFDRYTIRNIKQDEITIQAYKSTDGQFDGVAIFDANGRKRMPFDYQVDLKKIESLAYQYRTRPISQGGGGGSYIGFTIPHNLDSTANGKFWIRDIQPDELTIYTKARGLSYSYIIVLDLTGKEKSGEYGQRGDGDAYLKNDQGISDDLKIISKYAADYWRKSKPTRELSGSFDGFTIPNALVKTSNGSYSLAELQDEILYVRAVSSIGSGTEYFRIDSGGELRRLIFGEYRPPKVQPKNTIVEDARRMYDTADVKLNEVYRQLLVKRKSDVPFVKNLRNAEQLWIKYRNAQLIERFSQKESISVKNIRTRPQLIYLTFLTEKRIKELQELLNQP